MRSLASRGAGPRCSARRHRSAQTPQPADARRAGRGAGAKFAFINVQRVAAESSEGKASTAKVQALNQKKVSRS